MKRDDKRIQASDIFEIGRDNGLTAKKKRSKE